ncbi:MAG: GTPase HflX [Lachnospiraceae bacterium]|nr:GTPase HflX [Lachnospiraceae bacterium]
MTLFDTHERKENVILVGISINERDDAKESMDELEELVRTAGANCSGRVLQVRESVHPGTYIGKGKIEELKELIDSFEGAESIDGIVCDDELSPAQMKNLEEELGVKVCDRTMLILDIFALHATTGEGKLQVELAQQKYRSARLIGMRNLSRLGGGIGTRGPGEKKLETDRRIIKERISFLSSELKALKENREVTRALRSRSGIPVVAIVGYTNSGKSTLLNHLTGAGVLEEDMLFATLDPTTRNLELESGQQVLMTDTVGFIRKLPHHLIEAFRSTLEEAKYADVILHVVDASNEMAYVQMHIVYETLKHLGVGDKPVITVFNKQDLEAADSSLKDLKADRTVRISAKTGEGVGELLSHRESILRENKTFMRLLIPFSEGGALAQIRERGQLACEEYRDNGTYVEAYLPPDVAGRMKGFSTTQE